MSLSQAELARSLGVHPSVVTRDRLRGMPVDSLDSAKAWRLQHVRPRVRVVVPAPAAAPTALPAIARTAPPAPAAADGAEAIDHDGYWQSRARREKAEAELAELRLAEQMGKLVNAQAVRTAISKRVAGLRESLLQLPARVVPMLVASPDAASMDQILRAEIVTALAQLTESAE
jgi:hypothetical protein